MTRTFDTFPQIAQSEIRKGDTIKKVYNKPSERGILGLDYIAQRDEEDTNERYPGKFYLIDRVETPMPTVDGYYCRYPEKLATAYTYQLHEGDWFWHWRGRSERVSRADMENMHRVAPLVRLIAEDR